MQQRANFYNNEPNKKQVVKKMNIKIGNVQASEGSEKNANSEPSLQIGTVKKNDDEDDDQMSDYIDENFELDETDEYEGVNKNICNDFNTQIPNRNDIKQKTQITF
jgi:hypothetical protein